MIVKINIYLFVITPATTPVHLTIVFSGRVVILSNSVVTMKILNADIFGVEYTPYLTVPDVLCLKIVHKHNRLKHQALLHCIAGQTLLATRERTLKSTHSPLTCLPK